MKNKKLYSINILFSIASIYMLIVSKETEQIVVSIMCLLIFGVGGICVYLIEKEENKCIGQEKIITITDNRNKMIALMIGCFCFAIASYVLLPFNHLFDGTYRYSPTMGWITGVVGTLFFGYGFIISIKRFINPRTIMQILDEGIIILPQNTKNKIFISWEDIEGVAKNETLFCVYLKNPDKFPANKVLSFINTRITGTNINIDVNSINYNVDQIEDFINNKLSLLKKAVEDENQNEN